MNFLSPGGIVMMGTAVLLDLIGIALTVLDIFYGIGEVFSWLTDFSGLLWFGMWEMTNSMMAQEQTEINITPDEVRQRGKMMADSKENFQAASKKIAEAQKSAGAGSRAAGFFRRFRLLFAFVGEVLPLIGALPLWTLYTYSKLKNG